jgi:hypothetical protein
MKLSNQNIYNFRGCKCQMPLGGCANPFWGDPPPPPPPPPPPQKIRACPPPKKKNDKLRYACSRMFTGPYAGFFHQGCSIPNIRRIINDILKIVNIVFSRGQLPPPPPPPPPPVSPLCTVLNV